MNCYYFFVLVGVESEEETVGLVANIYPIQQRVDTNLKIFEFVWADQTNNYLKCQNKKDQI